MAEIETDGKRSDGPVGFGVIAIIMVLALLVAVGVVAGLSVTGFESRRDRDHRHIGEQAQQLDRLQQRVDSISLRLDELSPTTGAPGVTQTLTDPFTP